MYRSGLTTEPFGSAWRPSLRHFSVSDQATVGEGQHIGNAADGEIHSNVDAVEFFEEGDVIITAGNDLLS